MRSGRLAAFSDGVIAILITIMVLEHHHMLHMVESVNGRILWANLHLLFWLRAALGGDVKGKISMAAYAVAIPLAFMAQRLSLAIYVGVALLWFVPDRASRPA